MRVMIGLIPTLALAFSASGMHATPPAPALRPTSLHARRALKFTITPIQLPNGAQFPAAWGINDATAIVGSYYDAQSVHHGFLFQDGTLTNVDDPTGTDTNPLSINNKNAIVGEYARPDGVNHGFLYARGKFRDVGLGVRSSANGINDQGVIVGAYATCASFCPDHGFIKSHKAYTTIDVPQAINTTITGVSNFGLMTIIAVDQNG